MRLNEEVTLVLLGLGVDADLELSGVVAVGLVEVGPRQERGRLHLALAHVLYPGWQLIFVTNIILDIYNWCSISLLQNF